MVPAAAVANAILQKARDEGRTLTHMQLQKLVYIAHGWHLAVTGEPLVADPIQAWKYGPVIKDLYHRLSHYGHSDIQEPLTWWDADKGEYSLASPVFPALTRAVVDRVWELYKHFNGLQLSTLTHQKGTPWYSAVGERPDSSRDVVIPDSSIRSHYVELGRRDG